MIKLETVVAELRRAGVTGDALVEAILRIETTTDSRVAAARRQAEYRERKKVSKEGITNITDSEKSTNVDNISQSSQKNITTTAAREKKGTRFPDDFWPDAGSIELALELGFTEADLPELVAESRDYWTGLPGSRGLRTNWQGVFRNRLRFTASRRKSNGKTVFSNRDSFAQAIAFRRKLEGEEPEEGGRNGGTADLVLLPGLREKSA